MTVILRICPLLLFIFSIVYLVFVPFSFGFYHSNLAPKASLEAKKEIRKEAVQEKRENLIQKRDEAKQRAEARKEKLDAKKLQVCQRKEEIIKKRLESLTRLVTIQETKFDQISTRVQTFYTTKVLTKGKTVPNYDSLVADIASKKGAVDAALTNAKTNAEGFSCDGDDPKGALTQYRKGMQTTKEALKDYRTSIKNLIVAVKSVAGASDKVSPSPETTE